MGITQPAQVSIPSDVASIGIINRSTASEKNKVADKIDKILSLEGLNLDKEGAQNTILGLSYELERDNRFETVKIIEGQSDIEKGLDTAADYEITMVRVPNNLGIIAELPGHRININTAIKNGWRVYDPANRIIIDEYISNNQVYSKGEGINPIKALEAVIGRKEAVLDVSTNLGSNYASYTKPERIRIARDYFVRGSSNFKIAKRRAQTGNWDGAAELWNAELNNSNLKVAGRAYYNMAISNEINGNLNKAIEYASKSYADYGNKEGLRYVNMLKRRIVNQQELERQLAK
ncbi:unnamed protein product [Bathycoccus prasinos]